MTYQEIVNQNTLVLDNAQKKLVGGKIEFLDPTSKNPINVYTYDSVNEQYVPAVNPIYLDVNSRPEHTYFVAQLTYCRLYRYVGNFSDPMVDDDTNNWEFVRDWYGAYNESDAVDPTKVMGITALQQAPIELGTVNVVGYWTDEDCEGRTYVWDPNCAQEADNGYIVKSSTSDTGRWVLKFDGEWIPSTYYGVYPGHEENMNALLNYSSMVGSNNMPSAPGIWFVPGSYNATTNTKITNKKLLVDANTEFAYEKFQSAGVNVIGNVTHAIANFVFNRDIKAEVHSNWYHDVNYLLTSNASKIYIDANNFFGNSRLTTTPALVGTIIEGSNRLPITSYGDGAFISINKCQIIGGNIFSLNQDYVYFANMDITDGWFSAVTYNNIRNAVGENPNTVKTHAKHFAAPTVAINTVHCKNFSSMPLYSEFVYASRTNDGLAALDLEGRTYPSAYGELSRWYKIENITFTGNSQLNLRAAGIITTQVLNCKTTDSCALVLPPNGTYYIENCNGLSVNVASSIHISLIVKKSTVRSTGGAIDGRTCAINGEDSIIRMSVKMDRGENTDADYAQCAGVQFDKCILEGPTEIKTNLINLLDCELRGQKITVYPIKNGDTKYFSANIVGNTFYNESMIKYTIFDYSSQWKVMNNIDAGTWQFKNNHFSGTDPYGIYMPFTTALTERTPFTSRTFGAAIPTLYQNNTTTGTAIPLFSNLSFVSSNTMTDEIDNTYSEDYRVSTIQARIPFIDHRISDGKYTNDNAEKANTAYMVLQVAQDNLPYNGVTNNTMYGLDLYLFNSCKRDLDEVNGPSSCDGMGDAFMNRPAWCTSYGQYHSNRIVYCMPYRQ